MIFPILLVASAVGGLYYLYKKANESGIGVTVTLTPRTEVPINLVGGVQIPSDDFMFTGPPDDISTWPIITLGNDQWRVAPSPIGPVGIGQAKQIAESRGFQLPTPALVDAIWRAADLKIPPMPEPSDGTPKTMNVPEVFLRHKRKIDAQIDGRSFELIAGTHKDVVQADAAFPGLKNGAVGLYGWHADASIVKTTPDGKKIITVPSVGSVEVHAPVTPGEGLVIQQPFGGHGLDWSDYSQSVRLVKKV